MVADDRFPGMQNLAGVQWRLETIITGGGHSSHQSVFEPDPVELFGCGAKDEALLSEPDTSISGWIEQQWKLRIMARGASLEEVADSKLRSLRI